MQHNFDIDINDDNDDNNDIVQIKNIEKITKTKTTKATKTTKTTKTTLCAIPHTKINGLYLANNLPSDVFINALTELDTQQWLTPFGVNGRHVQHYGFVYDYKTGVINNPAVAFIPIITKLADLLSHVCHTSGVMLPDNQKDVGYIFNQCIVNNYLPGQGISEHIDNLAYGGIIGCFTLGNGANMRFRLADTVHDVYVAPNTLYIMSGDARYKWTHQMPNAKFDNISGFKTPRKRRVSVTFRYVAL